MEAREGISTALRRVTASVRSLAGNDAPDVVQEAVARALRSGVSLEAEQWLKTVAKRVAIDQARRRHETPIGDPVELEKSIRYHDGDPAEALVRSERAVEIQKAIESLPPRYRRVLQAHMEDGSPGAVAKSMGISAGAAWTLLSRARSRLKVELEQTGIVPAVAVGSGTGAGRWREIVAAGATAAVAATASLMPSEPPAPEPASEPPPAIISAQPAATPEPAPEPSPIVQVPKKAQDLVQPVTESLDEVAASVPKMVEVGNCPESDNERPAVGIEVKLGGDPDSGLLSGVVNLLPERLRHIKACL